jgi:DNA repair ATPase RecN
VPKLSIEVKLEALQAQLSDAATTLKALRDEVRTDLEAVETKDRGTAQREARLNEVIDAIKKQHQTELAKLRTELTTSKEGWTKCECILRQTKSELETAKARIVALTPAEPATPEPVAAQ